MPKPLPTSPEVSEIRAEAIRYELERIGLSQVEAAGRLGIAPQTLRRYLARPGAASWTPCPAWVHQDIMALCDTLAHHRATSH